MTSIVSEESSLKKVQISQKPYYFGDFGHVYRSSAIFWVKNEKLFKTTISITNYWKYKNNLDVEVLINLRTIDGQLLRRETVLFTTSDIYNFTPPSNFEGSVEVEVFGNKNMRIPYAAVMAIYECKNSISMVHSYTRTYSQLEIEDKKTYENGQEGCWSIIENSDSMSFGVIHNGPATQPSQRIQLKIRNESGYEKVIDIDLPELKPFETVIIKPRNYFNSIVEWLNGRPGNARLSFKLNGAFTRMLCANSKIDGSELQVTHSNFDYSTHESDRLEIKNQTAFMKTPKLRGLKTNLMQEIIIYPDLSEGTFEIEDKLKTIEIPKRGILAFEYPTNESLKLKFSCKDLNFPTRLVTGLRLKKNPNSIPAECSMGVLTHMQPKKHYSWMLVSNEFNSKILCVNYEEIFGAPSPDSQLVFKLYLTDIKIPLSKELTYSEFLDLEDPSLINIFNVESSQIQGFCWLSVWSQHDGLAFFSTLEKGDSISIEHCF